MASNAVTDVALAPLGGAADLSLVALFLQAHLIVKLTILGLLAASVWSWAIIVDKSLLFRRLRRRMARFEDAFWSGQSLDDLYRSFGGARTSGLAALFVTAMHEW